MDDVEISWLSSDYDCVALCFSVIYLRIALRLLHACAYLCMCPFILEDILSVV